LYCLHHTHRSTRVLSTRKTGPACEELVLGACRTSNSSRALVFYGGSHTKSCECVRQLIRIGLDRSREHIFLWSLRNWRSTTGHRPGIRYEALPSLFEQDEQTSGPDKGVQTNNGLERCSYRTRALYYAVPAMSGRVCQQRSSSRTRLELTTPLWSGAHPRICLAINPSRWEALPHPSTISRPPTTTVLTGRVWGSLSRIFSPALMSIIDYVLASSIVALIFTAASKLSSLIFKPTYS